MPGIWVHRDENGVVQGASVAEHTEPKTLREWRVYGWIPELVEAPTITVGQPLPPDARIIR
jgi:hypothetical protein